MSSPPPPPAGEWAGRGSTSIIPPTDYWSSLVDVASTSQIEQLHELSDLRLTEFVPSNLPAPETTATLLLERLVADGWLSPIERKRCPNCQFELDTEQAAQAMCPNCGEYYDQHGGVTSETVYIRNLPWSRSVDWVVAIHGMNTRGAWQEEFSWHLATTWGRSVPVAIYKYGILRAGVISARHRLKLQNALRYKLTVLRDQARSHGYLGTPDVIAHSFGTWLLGHLIQDEFRRDSEKRLSFGRVILLGSILPPEFDWERLRKAGLVEDVLNHAATSDRVVPLARAVIGDSGPSGTRGFKDEQIINLTAKGYGHSDLLSVDKCVVNAKGCRPCTGAAGEVSHLEHFYKWYWRPFLTMPSDELRGLVRAGPR